MCRALTGTQHVPFTHILDELDMSVPNMPAPDVLAFKAPSKCITPSTCARRAHNTPVFDALDTHILVPNMLAPHEPLDVPSISICTLQLMPPKHGDGLDSPGRCTL